MRRVVMLSYCHGGQLSIANLSRPAHLLPACHLSSVGKRLLHSTAVKAMVEQTVSCQILLSTMPFLTRATDKRANVSQIL